MSHLPLILAILCQLCVCDGLSSSFSCLADSDCSQLVLQENRTSVIALLSMNAPGLREYHGPAVTVRVTMTQPGCQWLRPGATAGPPGLPAGDSGSQLSGRGCRRQAAAARGDLSCSINKHTFNYF